VCKVACPPSIQRTGIVKNRRTHAEHFGPPPIFTGCFPKRTNFFLALIGVSR